MSDQLHVNEDAGAYVLGALSPEEAQRVEAHVATCSQCRQEVAELKSVVSVLPLAAESVEPAPDLKARILAACKSEDKADAILRRATSHLRTPKRDFWHRPGPAWVGAAGWVGLAAACIVAGVLIGMAGEHSAMMSALNRSGAPVNAVQAPVASRIAAESVNQVYAVKTEDTTQAAVDLIGQSHVWDFSIAKTGKRMPYKVIQPMHISHAMVVADMPPAKEGMVYQVWLVRKGKVHPGGVVMPGQRSQAIIPMRVESGDVIAFTMEPTGGSALPTGPFMMQETL